MAVRIFVLPMIIRGQRQGLPVFGPSFIDGTGLGFECIANARKFMLCRVIGDDAELDALDAQPQAIAIETLGPVKRAVLRQMLTNRGIDVDLTAPLQQRLENLAAAIHARRNGYTPAEVQAIIAEIQAG